MLNIQLATFRYKIFNAFSHNFWPSTSSSSGKRCINKMICDCHMLLLFLKDSSSSRTCGYSKYLTSDINKQSQSVYSMYHYQVSLVNNLFVYNYYTVLIYCFISKFFVDQQSCASWIISSASLQGKS